MTRRSQHTTAARTDTHSSRHPPRAHTPPNTPLHHPTLRAAVASSSASTATHPSGASRPAPPHTRRAQRRQQRVHARQRAQLAVRHTLQRLQTAQLRYPGPSAQCPSSARRRARHQGVPSARSSWCVTNSSELPRVQRRWLRRRAGRSARPPGAQPARAQAAQPPARSSRFRRQYGATTRTRPPLRLRLCVRRLPQRAAQARCVARPRPRLARPQQVGPPRDATGSSSLNAAIARDPLLQRPRHMPTHIAPLQPGYRQQTRLQPGPAPAACAPRLTLSGSS